MSLPLWIRTTDDLAALARALSGAAAVAVDTEADSLHHHPGKLCLVQVADDHGHAHLVDPLALRDLTAFAPVFADPGTVKVLHAAENDLAYLKGAVTPAVASIFDTAVAARFLGTTALGLDGLLRHYLGIEPGKSRQKDDWSRRPLTPAQEAYALNDVLHLIPLRDRLAEELEARGRLAWVAEECAALAAQPAPERTPDPEAYLRLKGTRDLDGRGLAVLRELHGAREALALALDRPPFMIMANDGLVELARRRPADRAAMLTVPGCTPGIVRRFGEPLLAAIARGLALSEASLPVRSAPTRPSVPAAVRRRIEVLRAWRAEASERFGLEPGLLLPQRVIDRIAAEPPSSAEALAGLEGMRRWRAVLLGRELLSALAAPGRPGVAQGGRRC
jgi:ribonuclease D